MAATQRLELRQSQSLVMTPQLQQAIKLLQLSNIEVAAFLERELEQNPLLERDEEPESGPAQPDAGTAPEASLDDWRDGGESGAAEGLAEDGQSDTSAPDSWDHSSGDRLTADKDGPLDTDFENHYDSNGPADEPGGYEASGLLEREARSSAGSSPSNAEGEFDQQLRNEVTLRSHLMDQLVLTVADPVDRLIGAHLIDSLDEAGYLTSELPEIATLLGCPVARVEAVLQQVQQFEPTGLFARDLAECLALQLAERNRLDPAMAALLANLDLVSEGRLSALIPLCGVDQDDVLDMLSELKALDPKPALSFDDAPIQPLIPDILLRPLRSGKWSVELNAESLPRVLVNETYYQEICARTRKKQDLDYLSERFQTANWLVKALHQRATTILKVSGEIVRQQDAFFRKGVAHLRPLTLKNIAEVVELHESTVSRVTSNKYIATPRGIYELKYFFSASIAASDGGSHSAEAIRHRIRLLIDQEAPKQILSDDSIVDILRRDGVEIARRTVAKYRDAMRIPSSVERRRRKAIQEYSL